MADLLTPGKTSDYLLHESRERGEVLTNLKLQKLLYYAQAWHLALNECCIFNEDFQAWIHGPVLPSQYHRFKDYRWKPIMGEISQPEVDANLKPHLDEVLDLFGPETAVALEIMTHRERPWLDARRGVPLHQPSENVITKISMKKYYQEMADVSPNDEGEASYER